jgi:CRP/FNR family transcriptional regulator, cyclic AMP receptor protein
MNMISQRKQTNGTAANSYQNGEFFKSLSAAAQADLESLLTASSYATDSVLFSEKQTASGVYVVIEGEIRISMKSTDGRRLAFHIAKPGELLGLSSTLTGGEYEMTADTLYPAKVAHISRQAFLEFLSRHPEVNAIVKREIARRFDFACEHLSAVETTTMASSRVPRLLMVWSDRTEHASSDGSRKPATAEEIGELIGAPLDTVFRITSVIKNQQLVAHHCCTLNTSNGSKLESYARS